MNHLQLFEQFGNRSVELKSRQGRKIEFKVQDGKIHDLINESGIRFPFPEGSPYNRSIEIWCCSNGFLLNGEDMCPEKKVFGIRQKDIPMGHELRTIYPGKFRK